MILYTISLFVHMLGFIAVFAALAMQQRAGANLRRMADPAQIRFWVQLLGATSTMIPAGSIMLFLSGVAMTAISWRNGPGWVAASAIGLIVMAALYLAIVLRRFRAMRAAVDAAGDHPSADVARLVRMTSTWTWLAVINGAALAIIWLMVSKPELAVSIMILAGGMALGGLLGYLIVRPRPARSAELAGG